MPLVFPRNVVWFTAGPTMYELEVLTSDPQFTPITDVESASGETTRGQVTFTPDQRLLIVALGEDILRNYKKGEELETTVLEIGLLTLPIGLGLRPALLFRLGEDALGFEPGRGHDVFGRDAVTLAFPGDGQPGQQVAEAQSKDDPEDRQSDDGNGVQFRSPFPVGEMNVPSLRSAQDL